MHLPYLPLSGLVTSAVASNLYASSYIGTVTSLQLIQHQNGLFSLNTVAVNDGSEPNPSWLTKDEFNDVVYCVDEGLTVGNGSLASYRTSKSGKLTQIDRHTVIDGPVSSVVYNGGKALALAHYTGSSLTTWKILSSGGVEALQAFTFKLLAPGPNSARQEAPHPHQVLIDPTDSFIIVPDLGADLLRVFSINRKTSVLTERTPFKASPGSGPRHGSFLISQGNTYFFLVSELSNMVSSYKVIYAGEELSFEKVFESGIYGNAPIPEGTAAAEGILSPDHKFFLTSSRNTTLFQIPNFDPKNSTLIPSDTLQSWKIDPTSGKLNFEQLAPAGGSFPRQFSLNKKGALVAVGLQFSSLVVIIERDVQDGRFVKIVAEVEVPGQVTSVIWDE